MRILDVLLTPIMFFLGGFTRPIQETHAWHIKRVDRKNFPDKKGLLVDYPDTSALFSHNSFFGLFHMPIFGGLRRYIVVKVSGECSYWNVVWKSEYQCIMQTLKVTDNKLMMLTGKGNYRVFAVNQNNQLLKVVKIATGYLGDGKHKNVRLF